LAGGREIQIRFDIFKRAVFFENSTVKPITIGVYISGILGFNV